MIREEIVAGVAKDLHTTEHAVDAALAQAMSLVQSMMAARTSLELSPVAGAESQAKALEAIAALGVAREAVVACHAELQKDHRRMGWGTYAAGPVNKPNDWETPIGPLRPPAPPASHLRVA